MAVTAEEEIVLLYALYMCGKRPSKSRATEFIVTNGLMKERTGDYDTVSTDESRVENRIAWTRQNLKDKGELAMPERGTWQITEAGANRLENVAMLSTVWAKDETKDVFDICWERFAPVFLERLNELGQRLLEKRASKQA